MKIKKISLQIFLAFAVIFTQAKITPATQHADNLLIILDCSYSMEEKIDGKRKIDIAKKISANVLLKLPSSAKVGLRVYGHKEGFLGLNACKASELKVPISQNNISKVLQEINKIEPVGMTPITYSIEKALENDFKGLKGKKRIILISDGKETCDSSPCKYALQLAKDNVELKIDVIGFGLNDKTAITQLKCTALATKGKFYSANNAEELSKSLSETLKITKRVYGQIIQK